MIVASVQLKTEPLNGMWEILLPPPAQTWKNCREKYSKGRGRFQTWHEGEVMEDLEEVISH